MNAERIINDNLSTPKPDPHACIKCSSTAHTVKFVEANDYDMKSEWPKHEFLLFTCTRCGYTHWEHCHDSRNVRDPEHKVIDVPCTQDDEKEKEEKEETTTS